MRLAPTRALAISLLVLLASAPSSVAVAQGGGHTGGGHTAGGHTAGGHTGSGHTGSGHTGGGHTGGHTGGGHTGGGHTGGGHTGGAAITPPPDAFSESYTEASRAWHAGRYGEALAGFRALHESSGRPELLYDVGVTCERLDRLDEAIVAFEGYVEALPMARNRAQIEARIASLRDDVRRGAAAASGTATTIAPSTSRPRGVMTLMGEPSAAAATVASPIAPMPSPIAEPSMGSISGSSPAARTVRTEIVTEGGGPEWIGTWPLLVLTLGAGISTAVAWDQATQQFGFLRDDCASLRPDGCLPEEIDGSSADDWEVATNVLLASTLTLGLVTLIVFVAEAATPTETRQVERTITTIDVGPGGVSVRGTF